jgi:hypothetical protein
MQQQKVTLIMRDEDPAILGCAPYMHVILSG